MLTPRRGTLRAADIFSDLDPGGYTIPSQGGFDPFGDLDPGSFTMANKPGVIVPGRKPAAPAGGVAAFLAANSTAVYVTAGALFLLALVTAGKGGRR